jgi:hypothetical protein
MIHRFQIWPMLDWILSREILQPAEIKKTNTQQRFFFT